MRDVKAVAAAISDLVVSASRFMFVVIGDAVAVFSFCGTQGTVGAQRSPTACLGQSLQKFDKKQTKRSNELLVTKHNK